MTETDPALWHSLALTEKLIKLKMKRQFSDLGISTAEAMILIVLSQTEHSEFFIDSGCLSGHAHRMSQDQIIADLHYDKGFMTRTMKTLLEAKLVNRSPNPNDARSVMYSLTDKGAALVPKIKSRVQTFNEALTSGLSSQEIESFNKTLSRLVANAKKQ